MPKASVSAPADRQGRRHNPLAEEYAPTSPTVKQRQSKKHKRARSDDQNDGGAYVDGKASQKILRIGQDLVEEADAERNGARPSSAFSIKSRFEDAGVDDYLEREIYEDDDEDNAWADEDGDNHQQIDVDPDDRDIFERFNPPSADDDPTSLDLDLLTHRKRQPPESLAPEQSVNLADLILEKIAAHEAASSPADLGDPALESLKGVDNFEDDEPLPPKVVTVYTQIGQLLSRHRSGPLPKPFKILPSLPPHQMPILLSITDPMSWTPHAHLSAVRLFISCKPHIATPYLSDILLPKVRDDIAQTKKLHAHLYTALKKSLYKPAAFFKGILFPLLDGSAEGGDCTLREAHILGSVLARVSIPVLHSAAALLRLCDISAERFSTRLEDGAAGAVNTFIRVLLAKRYALPYKVIDALVLHFARYKAMRLAANSGPDADVDMLEAEVDGPRPIGLKLPVLWHQSLLAFSQRYRNDITEEQREVLLDVINTVGHPHIGPEIRRELLEGRARGSAVNSNSIGLDGDDTMAV